MRLLSFLSIEYFYWKIYKLAGEVEIIQKKLDEETINQPKIGIFPDHLAWICIQLRMHLYQSPIHPDLTTVKYKE